MKIDQIKRVSKEDNLLIEKSYFISEIIDSRIALSLKFLNFQKPITSNYSYTQSITACMRCNIYPLFYFLFFCQLKLVLSVCTAMLGYIIYFLLSQHDEFLAFNKSSSFSIIHLLSQYSISASDRKRLGT